MKHFIHMQHFELLTSLVIVFVHWVSTGVLYEPRHFSLFWDYIPESDYFFCQSAPPARSPCNPTNIKVAQLSNDAVVAAPCAARLNLMGSNQKQRFGSEFAKWHDIHTPKEYVDAQRPNNSDSKLLCHELFQYVRHHVHDVHWTGEFATVIWRLHSFTVSFCGDVRGESGLIELTSVNRATPQWASGQFTNIFVPAWFGKWRDIKFWCMC